MAKKYIDADHLKVEIEKHIKEVKDAADRFTLNMGFFDAKLSGIYDVMAIIDSLQQEPQDVNFKIEERKWVHNVVDNIFPEGENFMSVLVGKILKDTAHHFYELGRNTRKEE